MMPPPSTAQQMGETGSSKSCVTI